MSAVKQTEKIHTILAGKPGSLKLLWMNRYQMLKYKQFFEKLMYVVLIAKHQSGKTLSVGQTSSKRLNKNTQTLSSVKSVNSIR